MRADGRVAVGPGGRAVGPGRGPSAKDRKSVV